MSDGWDTPERRWHAASLAVFASLVVLVALTFQDYGITWDEEWQNLYGVKLLSFYLSGFTDRSAFEYRDLFWYGGAFDLVAAAINRVSPFGEYETRHLLGGLIGIFGIVGAWRLTRLLAGERAAFLAAALLALTPSLYGHMFNNPKDAPFAWGMIWSVYFLCRAMHELPKPRVLTTMGLGIALGLTLGTRIAGVLAIAYLGAALAVHLGLMRGEGSPWRALAREAAQLAMRFAPALVLAYVIMAIAWPWSAMSPLNPLRALIYLTEIPWRGEVLVDGTLIPGSDLPASYLPLHLAIKLPEIALIGLAAGAFILAGVVAERPFAQLERAQRLSYFLVMLSAAFPILYCVIVRPLDFNGIRHFLFAVPPLVVLAAISLDGLWAAATRALPTLARLVGPAFAVAAGLQIWVMVGLHPNQYVYFNQVVGGTQGAAGRFELDYWGNSLAEASRRLGEMLNRERGGKPLAGTYWAAICGYPLSALYYLPKNFKLTNTVSEAEFVISTTQPDCNRISDGKPMVEVKRNGAVLSVVKDRRHVLAARGRQVTVSRK